MRRLIKHSLRVVTIVAIALVLAYGIFSYLNRRSAINATLEWGRLAPFPESAQNFVITPVGNMFTRSFRVSFSAPAGDINRWVDESPGLRETQPVREGSLRKYRIKPGSGAQYAEVVIDDSNHQVRVYVAWS